MTTYRFGAFALRAGTGQLRQNGDIVKLPPQPSKVLEVLLQRGGEVVTRSEIREQIWSGDTFVDFDQSLNFCIRQIREALGTLGIAANYRDASRRGYRFSPCRVSRRGTVGVADPSDRAALRMLRPDAETEFLTFSLPDALTSSLSGLESLVVRSSLVASRFAAEVVNPRTIAAEADVDLIVTGTLRAGDDVRPFAAHRRVSRHAPLVPHGTSAGRRCLSRSGRARPAHH
jgi:DNA-binding winged helix-turn-helix (wHTH) protein